MQMDTYIDFILAFEKTQFVVYRIPDRQSMSIYISANNNILRLNCITYPQVSTARTISGARPARPLD
jgi:hypothetical protein